MFICFDFWEFIIVEIWIAFSNFFRNPNEWENYKKNTQGRNLQIIQCVLMTLILTHIGEYQYAELTTER